MRHSDSEDRDHQTRGVSTASLLADGIETRYLRTGAGPTVPLIHPGGTAEDDLVLALARRFRVIVPDLPEDGSHPAPPDWLRGVFDGLGIAEAAIVTCPAQVEPVAAFARQEPDRVKGTVMLAPT